MTFADFGFKWPGIVVSFFNLAGLFSLNFKVGNRYQRYHTGVGVHHFSKACCVHDPPPPFTHGPWLVSGLCLQLTAPECSVKLTYSQEWYVAMHLSTALK